MMPETSKPSGSSGGEDSAEALSLILEKLIKELESTTPGVGKSKTLEEALLKRLRPDTISKAGASPEKVLAEPTDAKDYEEVKTVVGSPETSTAYIKDEGPVDVLDVYSSEDCLTVAERLINLLAWAGKNTMHPLAAAILPKGSHGLSYSTRQEPFTRSVEYNGDVLVHSVDEAQLSPNSKERSYVNQSLPLKVDLNITGTALYVSYEGRTWKVTSGNGGIRVDEIHAILKTKTRSKEQAGEPVFLGRPISTDSSYKNLRGIGDILYFLSRNIGDFRSDDPKLKDFVDLIRDPLKLMVVREPGGSLHVGWGPKDWFWVGGREKVEVYPNLTKLPVAVSAVDKETIIFEVKEGPAKGRYLVRVKENKLLIDLQPINKIDKQIPELVEADEIPLGNFVGYLERDIPKDVINANYEWIQDFYLNVIKTTLTSRKPEEERREDIIAGLLSTDLPEGLQKYRENIQEAAIMLTIGGFLPIGSTLKTTVSGTIENVVHIALTGSVSRFKVGRVIDALGGSMVLEKIYEANQDRFRNPTIWHVWSVIRVMGVDNFLSVAGTVNKGLRKDEPLIKWFQDNGESTIAFTLLAHMTEEQQARHIDHLEGANRLEKAVSLVKGLREYYGGYTFAPAVIMFDALLKVFGADFFFDKLASDREGLWGVVQKIGNFEEHYELGSPSSVWRGGHNGEAVELIDRAKEDLGLDDEGLYALIKSGKLMDALAGIKAAQLRDSMLSFIDAVDAFYTKAIHQTVGLHQAVAAYSAFSKSDSGVHEKIRNRAHEGLWIRLRDERFGGSQTALDDWVIERYHSTYDRMRELSQMSRDPLLKREDMVLSEYRTILGKKAQQIEEGRKLAKLAEAYGETLEDTKVPRPLGFLLGDVTNDPQQYHALNNLVILGIIDRSYVEQCMDEKKLPELIELARKAIEAGLDYEAGQPAREVQPAAVIEIEECKKKDMKPEEIVRTIKQHFMPGPAREQDKTFAGLSVDPLVRGFLKNWSRKRLEDSAGLEWIGRVLQKRGIFIHEAEASFGAISKANYNMALNALVKLVQEDSERIISDLKARYPFLEREGSMKQEAIREYYKGYVGEVIADLGIEDQGLADYLRSTLIDWFLGNPSIVFNPMENRASVAGCPAVMSEGMRAALDSGRYGEVSDEIRYAMSLAMEAEVVRHECEHVVTGAIQAYLSKGVLSESAMNLVWEGFAILKTVGGQIEIIGKDLADRMHFLQDREKGFEYDSPDSVYIGEKRTCEFVDEASGNSLINNVIETIRYGLRPSSYRYKDLLECDTESELEEVYAGLNRSLKELEDYLKKSGSEADISSVEAQRLIQNIKVNLSRITSTYKRVMRGTPLSEKALGMIESFISSMEEGTMGSLEAGGFFERFLDEHNGYVPG